MPASPITMFEAVEDGSTPIEPSLPVRRRGAVDDRGRRGCDRAPALGSSVPISPGKRAEPVAQPRGAARRGGRAGARHRSRGRGRRDRVAERHPACDLHRQGQGRGHRGQGESRGDRSRRHGLRAVAGAAAQSRTGVRLQGDRPHRAHPRNLRPQSAHRRGRAASRARPSGLSALAPRALVDPSRATARRLRLSRRTGRNARSRPTAASFRSASSASSGSSKGSSAGAPCIARAAAPCLIRWSRWSATPTPGNRRCSIG